MKANWWDTRAITGPKAQDRGVLYLHPVCICLAASKGQPNRITKFPNWHDLIIATSVQGAFPDPCILHRNKHWR